MNMRDFLSSAPHIICDNFHSQERLSTRKLSSYPILEVDMHPSRFPHEDNRLQSLIIFTVLYYAMKIHEYARFLEQCYSYNLR